MLTAVHYEPTYLGCWRRQLNTMGAVAAGKGWTTKRKSPLHMIHPVSTVKGHSYNCQQILTTISRWKITAENTMYHANNVIEVKNQPWQSSRQGGIGPVLSALLAGAAMAQPKCFRYGLQVGILLWVYSNWSSSHWASDCRYKRLLLLKIMSKHA